MWGLKWSQLLMRAMPAHRDAARRMPGRILSRRVRRRNKWSHTRARSHTHGFLSSHFDRATWPPELAERPAPEFARAPPPPSTRMIIETLHLAAAASRGSLLVSRAASESSGESRRQKQIRQSLCCNHLATEPLGFGAECKHALHWLDGASEVRRSWPVARIGGGRLKLSWEDR